MTGNPEHITLAELSDRFRQGLSPKASASEREDFPNYLLGFYRANDWKNDLLSEFFAEYFRLFSEEHFAALSSAVRRNFRDYLHSNRSYVPKVRNVQIAEPLLRVGNEELPWPSGDKECPEPTFHHRPMHSPQRQPSNSCMCSGNCEKPYLTGYE